MEENEKSERNQGMSGIIGGREIMSMKIYQIYLPQKKRKNHVYILQNSMKRFTL